jgi:hypothetical protein
MGDGWVRYHFRNPWYIASSAPAELKDLRRQTTSLLHPSRILVGAAEVALHPLGRLDFIGPVDSERAPCLGPISRLPLSAKTPPTRHRSARRTFPATISCTYVALALGLLVERGSRVSHREKIYRTGRDGALDVGLYIVFLKAPRNEVSRNCRVTPIALPTLLAPYCAKLGTVTRFQAPTTGR